MHHGHYYTQRMTECEHIRSRFPGCSGPWARFDAPAGSQTVDSAIEAMADLASNSLSEQHLERRRRDHLHSARPRRQRVALDDGLL